MQWLPIERFSNYTVNRDGQVRNNTTKRILKPQINQARVVYVVMIDDWGARKNVALANLVARIFLFPPHRTFENPTPIHLDGDHRNCSADNLEWRPRWYALEYTRQFKNPFPSPLRRPLRAQGTDEVFSCSLDAAMRYGLREYDVVRSIIENVPVWPTWQQFELAAG